MTVLAVGSATLGAVGAAQAENNQRDALQQQANSRQEELQAQADSQAGERAKAGRAERSRMLVAQGESGAGGQSTGLAIMDSFLQQNQDIGIIQKQSVFDTRATNAQLATASSQISHVDPLSAGLQIATAGVGG